LLSKNELTSIPTEIGFCTNLTKLGMDEILCQNYKHNGGSVTSETKELLLLQANETMTPTSTDESNKIGVSSSRQGDEGTEQITFKGVISLLDSFEPTQSCLEYIHTLESSVPLLAKIIESILLWHETFKWEPNPRSLTEDEIIALGIYTWDVRQSFSGEKEDNFFWILNKMLLERKLEKMREWAGYLFYLQSGLSKLPDVQCTVFRGISHEGIEIIRTKYVQGRPIHWSSYTSTTPFIRRAKQFAKQGGEKGLFSSSVLCFFHQ